MHRHQASGAAPPSEIKLTNNHTASGFVKSG